MEKKRDVTNAGIAAGTSEIVSRYGSANKEYLVAYSGVDNATGAKPVSLGLEELSKRKINPKNAYAGENQQAGFAAEVMTAADENAEKIISGNTKNWYSRRGLRTKARR